MHETSSNVYRNLFAIHATTIQNVLERRSRDKLLSNCLSHAFKLKWHTFLTVLNNNTCCMKTEIIPRIVNNLR